MYNNYFCILFLLHNIYYNYIRRRKMTKTNLTFNDAPQIRLDEKTYQILYNDYLYFKKRSLNTLVNDIIKQYQIDFLNTQNKKYHEIIKILKNSDVDKKILETLASQLLTLDLKLQNLSIGKKTKPLKIHINYRYENYFLNLEQLLKKYNNLIGFGEILRYLIVQYTKLSRSEREIVLFENQILILKEAIKKAKMVQIHLVNNETINFNPYEIINPLDDEGNYLFGERDKTADAIAIHTIKHAVILNESSKISDESINMLKKLKNLKFDYEKLSNYASTNILNKVIQLQKRTNLL